jgi:hypothetical protein
MKNYTKVKVEMSSSIREALNLLGKYTPEHRYVYISKTKNHYLVKKLNGMLNVDTQSISFDGPLGYKTIYVKPEALFKVVKDTKLARKIYPEAEELGGYLYILRDNLRLE